MEFASGPIGIVLQALAAPGVFAVLASFVVAAVFPILVTVGLGRDALSLSLEQGDSLPEWHRAVLLGAETVTAASLVGLVIHTFGPGQLLGGLVLVGGIGAVIWTHSVVMNRRGVVWYLPRGLRGMIERLRPVDWLSRWDGDMGSLLFRVLVSVAWFVDAEGAEEIAAVAMARERARRNGGFPSPRETAEAVAMRVVAGRTAEMGGRSTETIASLTASDGWLLGLVGLSSALLTAQLYLSSTSRSVMRHTIAGTGLAVSGLVAVGAIAGMYAREPIHSAVTYALQHRRPQRTASPPPSTSRRPPPPQITNTPKGPDPVLRAAQAAAGGAVVGAGISAMALQQSERIQPLVETIRRNLSALRS